MAELEPTPNGGAPGERLEERGRLRRARAGPEGPGRIRGPRAGRQARTRSRSTRSRMATPRSMSSKSTKRTSAKSSAARAASSAASAPSSKPPPPAKASASTSTSSEPPAFLVVAQVLSAHGIRGELKCRVVTDFPKRRFKRGSTRLDRRPAAYVIRPRACRRTNVLLRLDELTDRDAAETLRGLDVEVPPTTPWPLPRGQFYWHQVIGLDVEDTTTARGPGQGRRHHRDRRQRRLHRPRRTGRDPGAGDQGRGQADRP